MAKYDSRSAEAKEYRRLYKTARWSRLREYQLAQEPLCQRCKRFDIVTEAEVVHHGQGGHKGDATRFWDPDILESMCKQCHDVDGRAEDQGKTSPRVGPDGYYVD